MVNQYQMIIPENKHASNILLTEQFVFKNTHAYTCTYTHITANNVKRHSGFEKWTRMDIWKYWREKKDKWCWYIKLFSQNKICEVDEPTVTNKRTSMTKDNSSIDKRSPMRAHYWSCSWNQRSWPWPMTHDNEHLWIKTNGLEGKQLLQDSLCVCVISMFCLIFGLSFKLGFGLWERLQEQRADVKVQGYKRDGNAWCETRQKWIKGRKDKCRKVKI